MKEPPTPNNPPNNNNAFISDNIAIREFNEKAKKTLREFCEAYTELSNQAEEQKAILLSLEKEETPEITFQIDIITAGKPITFGVKEELTGQGGWKSENCPKSTSWNYQ